MRRSITMLFLAVAMVTGLSGCNIYTQFASESLPEFEPYDGKSLSIAVIGEPPIVTEKHVRFTRISFDEMTRTENMNMYDAVMIRENHLPEAAESQYADVYMSSPIPTFFIGANTFVHFTEANWKYDEEFNWKPGTGYAVGVLVSPKKDTLNSQGVGLYNDIKTDETLKNMYSLVFSAIEEMNQSDE